MEAPVFVLLMEDKLKTERNSEVISLKSKDNNSIWLLCALTNYVT